MSVEKGAAASIIHNTRSLTNNATKPCETKFASKSRVCTECLGLRDRSALSDCAAPPTSRRLALFDQANAIEAL